jgi:hypothetical protein
LLNFTGLQQFDMNKNILYIQILENKSVIEFLNKLIIAWATNFSHVQEKRVGDFIMLVRVT